MIIDKGNQEKAEVIGGIDTSNSMRMNLNAQSYELLLSNLYSDPLGSTIRELCTNALEANMAAKTNKKVVVQLPSVINSNLIIRDFGTGLDDKEIDKYLNCLFSSSKGESNDNMGGFGLGSKSPLALVDSFYLSSVKDGIQYDYMWIKERGQIPTPIFQGSDKVKKENGITITVPLGSSSKIPLHNLTTHVKNAANRQLFGFKDQVMIVTDATVDYDKMTDVTESTITWKEVLDTPNITLFTKDAKAAPSMNRGYGYGSASEFYVRVGVVIYRYSTSFDTSSLSNYVRNLRDFIVVINVPIGELDIPMSREEVNTTSDNARIIQRQYNLGKLDIEKEYKKIPFDFDVGAVKFHDQLKTYSNNTQVIWNIKASQSALIKHDGTLLNKFLKYIREYNTNYKSITTNEFLQNVDLYNPLQHYFNRIPQFANKNLLKISSINSTSVCTGNFAINTDTAYVMLPSKLPFGVRVGDLLPYLQAKHPTKTFSRVTSIQHKTDYADAKDLGDFFKEVFESQAKQSGITDLLFVNDVDLDDLKDEVKKLRALNKTTVVANDFVVGARLAALENHYSEFRKDSTDYTWSNGNSNDRVYRVNKLLDSNGKTIPVGADYVSTYDKVFLSTTNSLPIEATSTFSVLNKTEADSCLKNTCFLRVSENVYDKVVASFTKDGIDFYTKDNMYKMTVPLLEDQFLKDPTNQVLTTNMSNIVGRCVASFFTGGSWRIDKSVLKTKATEFLKLVEDEFKDKNNIYYKHLVKETGNLITKVVNNIHIPSSDYNFNGKAVDAFEQELFDMMTKSLTKDKSTWLKDYNSLTVYTDKVTRALFNNFGYSI